MISFCVSVVVNLRDRMGDLCKIGVGTFCNLKIFNIDLSLVT